VDSAKQAHCQFFGKVQMGSTIKVDTLGVRILLNHEDALVFKSKPQNNKLLTVLRRSLSKNKPIFFPQNADKGRGFGKTNTVIFFLPSFNCFNLT
jgi:hypothetical protein